MTAVWTHYVHRQLQTDGEITFEIILGFRGLNEQGLVVLEQDICQIRRIANLAYQQVEGDIEANTTINYATQRTSWSWAAPFPTPRRFRTSSVYSVFQLPTHAGSLV
jgi:hypothetical protein